MCSHPRGERNRRRQESHLRRHLSCTRTGSVRSRTPILTSPGGPGLASVAPYAALRSWAKRHRVDVIMIGHRGVGLSRRTTAEVDLTADDMWLRPVVEDIRAVLGAEQVPPAVLYGSSYGTYVAHAFAVEHPNGLLPSCPTRPC
ncbi:alpha/beta fold hydrolase [Pseudarthrobacter albicanus]|uniref:alpha/beta fold hydrolase n=1 Tax=Pseudarthrobacter albicanus TaxID=2823873 RepID=UPI003556AAEB